MGRSCFATKPVVPKITHVIFDFDGVILDTEHLFAEINDTVLRRYGRKLSPELNEGRMGRKLVEAVEYLLKQTGLDSKVTVDEYLKHYEELVDEKLTHPPELPGARRLLCHLLDKDVPVAICTGSDKREFDIKTQYYRDLIDAVTVKVLCGSDPEVTQGKPSPVPYQVAMSRFPKKPESAKNVLVFEDSFNGIRSAAAAGATPILALPKKYIPTTWEQSRHEMEPLVAEVLHSLEDFKLARYGLPPYEGEPRQRG